MLENKPKQSTAEEIKKQPEEVNPKVVGTNSEFSKATSFYNLLIQEAEEFAQNTPDYSEDKEARLEGVEQRNENKQLIGELFNEKRFARITDKETYFGPVLADLAFSIVSSEKLMLSHQDGSSSDSKKDYEYYKKRYSEAKKLYAEATKKIYGNEDFNIIEDESVGMLFQSDISRLDTIKTDQEKLEWLGHFLDNYGSSASRMSFLGFKNGDSGDLTRVVNGNNRAYHKFYVIREQLQQKLYGNANSSEAQKIEDLKKKIENNGSVEETKENNKELGSQGVIKDNIELSQTNSLYNSFIQEQEGYLQKATSLEKDAIFEKIERFNENKNLLADLFNEKRFARITDKENYFGPALANLAFLIKTNNPENLSFKNLLHEQQEKCKKVYSDAKKIYETASQKLYGNAKPAETKEKLENTTEKKTGEPVYEKVTKENLDDFIKQNKPCFMDVRDDSPLAGKYEWKIERQIRSNDGIIISRDFTLEEVLDMHKKNKTISTFRDKQIFAISIDDLLTYKPQWVKKEKMRKLNDPELLSEEQKTKNVAERIRNGEFNNNPSIKSFITSIHNKLVEKRNKEIDYWRSK